MISRDRIFKLNIKMYLRNEKMKNSKIKRQLQQRLLKLKQSDSKITVAELIFSRKRKQSVFNTNSLSSSSFSTSASRTTVSTEITSRFIRFKMSIKRQKTTFEITKISENVTDVNRSKSSTREITKLLRSETMI